MDPAAPRRRLPPAGRGPGDPGDDPPVARGRTDPAVRRRHRRRRWCDPSPAAVPPRALPGAGGGPAPGPAQLLVRADARRGGQPGGLRGGGLVRHDPRRALRHRHVGAAVRPLRRALPARHHLRLHHPPGRGHGRDVEPGHHPGGPARSSTAPSPAASSPKRSIRRWETDFFHQFILAGAYRQLRLRQRAEARDVLRLFDLPEIRHLGASPRWLPVRVAFTAATAGARTRAEPRPRGDV